MRLDLPKFLLQLQQVTVIEDTPLPPDGCRKKCHDVERTEPLSLFIGGGM